MQIIFYLFIFLIGIFSGSFFTLAVHRLPLGQNITHKHSYCPKCNHKLGVLDLIPVFSYIFLRGKCRYCKDKVRPRYLILEILSGTVFVLFALSLNINLYNIEISKIVYLFVGLLYISSLFIIAGIDKENKNIQKSVLIFGIIVIAAYIIYLYIIEKANIYKYAIYLFLMLIFIIIDTIILKKKGQTNYAMQILLLCIYLSLFTDELIFVLSAIFVLLFIASKVIFYKMINIGYKSKKKDELYSSKFHIGTYLSVTYIAVLIITNYIFNYIYY